MDSANAAFDPLLFEDGRQVVLPVPPNLASFRNNANVRRYYDAGFVAFYDETTSTGALYNWADRTWTVVQPYSRARFWDFCAATAIVVSIGTGKAPPEFAR